MKRYFTILNILLITATIYFSVNVFYKVITTKLDHVNPIETVNKNVSSSADETYQPLSYYKKINERNLFNTKREAAQKSRQVDIENLKQTDLELKLWGTVTGTRDKAYAVIEEIKQKKQNLYRVGDSIQNAMVTMILREKVILSVNGKDEILEMEQILSSRSIEKSLRPSNISTTSSPFKRSTTARPQNIKLKRSQIEKAMGDINNLMRQVQIRPYLENGKPSGLILSGIKPNSIFKKMGLRNGDVIKGVEGEDIESVEDAINFYTKLKSSSSATIQLRRRGELKNINYHIE